MEKIAVEQSIYGPTYQAPAQPGDQKLTNLGGYAFSFKELLQRVGARLENAFSAADKSSGLVSSKVDGAPEPVAREQAPKRDDSADYDDRGAVRDTAKANGDGSSASISDDGAPRDPVAADNRGDSDRGERADGKTSQARDSHGAKDSTHGDADVAADGTKTDGGQQAADNGKHGGQAGAHTGKDSDGAATLAGAVAQAASGQAAAIYAAGTIGAIASNGAKSGDVNNGQQAERVGDAVQGMVAQIAGAAAGKAAAGNKPGNQQSNADKNGNANGAAKAAAAAAAAAAGKPGDAVQAQARQISQLIGAGNKAQIDVTVDETANQLTSKPLQALTVTSVLGKDESATGKGPQQQATGQSQGTGNGQNAQLAQAAIAQQAQTAQQSGPQNAGLQGGAAGSGASGGSAIGAQSSGGPVHGGGESSNTSQLPGAQQSQQAQQAKENSPTQQAQQAQRSNLPGASVADQISVKISKALQAGTDKISIQLRPAELGRVDVKLEMTHDGRVMTVVTAEKQDTLDLLRRDASELQKALADAGLQSGDMQFNLKGEQQQRTADGDDQPNGNAGNAEPEASETAENESAVLTAWESGIFMDGRIDMRA